MDAAGYENAESICNEWNFVINWDTRFIESIETIIGLKGAAFTAACMLHAQDQPIDMLMYYDARPCPFNCLFDFYTLRPIKGYYPFVMFSELYARGTQIAAESDDPAFYAVAAEDETGAAMMIARYRMEDAGTLPLRIEGLADGMRVYALDAERDLTPLPAAVENGCVTVDTEPYTVLLIK